jgi:putative CocE/NonD family hydrolase
MVLPVSNRTARKFARRLALLACLLLSGSAASAQGREYVVEHYAKSEHTIAMRDGVKLFTSIYAPRDTSKTWPILLKRTPYTVAPYGPDAYPDSLGPSEACAREGFIFAYQDVRGRAMSEGEFENVRPVLRSRTSNQDIDESTDAYDTIEWLVRNVGGNNGKVGVWGISYPGFYASCAAVDAHPSLVAVSPQAPIADWFIGDDFHHNGALYLPHAFNFLSGFGRPRPEPTAERKWKGFEHGTLDGYRFFLELGPLRNADELFFKGDVAFWNEMLAHPNYDDFWQARNLRPHLANVRPAVMTVGGWFDAEDLFGALETYRSIEHQAPDATNVLVMGPWVHGGWARGDGDRLGDVRFGEKSSLFYRERIELPFFLHYLKGAPLAKLQEAWMFETGGNRWHALEAWPPPGAKPRPLYLRAGGRLAFEPPGDGEPEPFDEYVSDPARPVPFTSAIAIGMTREHMVEDQRFAARRPDVLVYQTAPLEKALTVAGALRARLHVSTTGTDSDWVLKLIDVYPDDFPDPDPDPEARPGASRMGGFQQLVRGEAMRGRFRESYERPVAFRPGERARVEWVLPDVFHTFRPGHRVMIQVQSTWFPLVDRNPQTFVDIATAGEEDFRKATQRVWHASDAPSMLELSVLE